MALRQDSDKEPRIELFIKVSCSTFTRVGQILLFQIKHFNLNKVTTFSDVGSNKPNIKYKNNLNRKINSSNKLINH